MSVDARKIRVLVVDDSALARRAITEALSHGFRDRGRRRRQRRL